MQTTKKRVTSIEVAKRAGVSQATVSRAFNPDSKMQDKTRQKVLAAAKELNYTPDAIARSMSSNRTNIIAVIMKNPTNPFYAKILTSFSSSFQKHNKQILFFNLENEKNINTVMQQVLQYRVDAILLTDSPISFDWVDTCAQFNIPVLLFNRYANNHNITAVCCDNVEAGRNCANYLVQKGFSRFAYIGSIEDVSTSIDRQKGFLDRLQELGFANCDTYKCSFSYEAGQEIMREVLSTGGKSYDAIFCANDLIASGCMDVARYEHHLSLPEDLAIIGFDNIDLASYPSYNLTTFVQPLEAMIEKTVQLIMNPSETDMKRHLFLYPCKIIERKTT
ncbi:MAG: LacI family DNA-binding transcriptional regulator [Eubacterium sp.]|nr:LacI family DNA-binding transcriptional regulator [Eubacterium sp.]